MVSYILFDNLLEELKLSKSILNNNLIIYGINENNFIKIDNFLRTFYKSVRFYEYKGYVIKIEPFIGRYEYSLYNKETRQKICFLGNRNNNSDVIHHFKD